MKTVNKLICVLILISARPSFAQDTIVNLDGTIIAVEIIDLSYNLIGYKNEYRTIYQSRSNIKNYILHSELKDEQKLTIHRSRSSLASIEKGTGQKKTLNKQFDATQEKNVGASFNGDLKKYLASNLKFPPTVLDSGINRTCYVHFLVDVIGKISQVTVVRGIQNCVECNEEAIRLIKEMPNWKPSTEDGFAIESWVNLSIQFKLEQKNK
jgi:hypothetical protein